MFVLIDLNPPGEFHARYFFEEAKARRWMEREKPRGNFLLFTGENFLLWLKNNMEFKERCYHRV